MQAANFEAGVARFGRKPSPDPNGPAPGLARRLRQLRNRDSRQRHVRVREQPDAVNFAWRAVEHKVTGPSPERVGGRVDGHVEVVTLEVDGGGIAVDGKL